MALMKKSVAGLALLLCVPIFMLTIAPLRHLKRMVLN
jgi:hypothetical protein